MSSSDDAEMKPDSILLFQFSRPQNLVCHWKFKKPVLTMHSMLDQGILIVVNELFELQKIYNGFSMKALNL